MKVMTISPAAGHPVARAFGLLHRTVMRLIEAVAVVLLVTETVILLAGVVSRYVLDNPLSWSDELASMLFIWLSMLGAVLALDRDEHMRLSAVVNRLSPNWRGWFETMSALVVCVFVAFIIVPAWQHAVEQMPITTPALELPDGLRAAALPVGIVLMFVAAVSRMAQRTTLRQFITGLAVLLAISGMLWLARSALAGMGNYNLIVFFVVLVGFCVVGGIPIAFAFGTATFAYLALTTHAPLAIVVSRMDEGMSGLVLLAVPLFVLLGGLIELSGLARSLIDFMAALLGHVRGGLQYVLLGAMFLVSGISGSKAADMAAVAPALFPEMKRHGSKPEDLVALLAATGAMTETIPPSLVMITIGAVCSVSISALFVGGLLPACVATLAIVAVCFIRTRKGEAPATRRASFREIASKFVVAVPALALPILIRTAVIKGVATATEVSTVGILYTIVVGLIVHLFRKQIDFRRVYPMLVDSAALSGAILLIIGMATAMAWALTQSGFSAQLVAVVQSMPGGATGFLFASVAIFIVLGSVLEGIPAIVLFGPLLFPVARALGINDVHYAMVVVLSMGIGLFAPPVGVGFYAACAIGKISPDRAMNRIWGYIAALIVALIVVVLVPWVSVGFIH